MTTSRVCTRAVLPGLLAASLWPAMCAATPRTVEARPLGQFPREQVVVETHSARRHVFDAWRADTAETRAQGLMFVTEIDATQAMIFVYEPPQLVGMWMHNTYISLDMLFADEHGCIVHVAQHAKPLSVDTIAAEVPVAYVLELRAGTAAALGIAAGDRLVRASDTDHNAARNCTR